jgi:two-component system chemotaxis response regulator CheB
MIRVLIVDDSAVAREFLAHILKSDPDLEVAGFAESGAEALAAVMQIRPDAVTMDVHMPVLDGYEATVAIMGAAPTPIIIVSASTSVKDTPSLFRALDAGALAAVLRPPGIGHPDHAAAAQQLIVTVKAMAEIKLDRRPAGETQAAFTAPLRRPIAQAASVIQLVAIGASIGGPPVLNTILSLLKPALPVPVLIVQHISLGFVQGFAEWLGAASNYPVHLAANGEQPLPGHAYVAPEGYHLGVAAGPRLLLSSAPPEHGSRPSVSCLLRSVAPVQGPGAAGVLLTGMGRDGAAELKLLRDTGAPTLVQDEASSVVHGMPGEAIRLGAAALVQSPERIAATLLGLTRNSRGPNA